MDRVSSLDLLKQLKREYNNDNVSALVGAGLSKNAIPDFPLWGELLMPIVKEMYKGEFDDLVAEYGADPGLASLTKERKEGKACDALLLKYGNLEVVSDYIRRKGIGHECIDAYIEERIKPATKLGASKKWKCGADKYKVNALDIHVELLKCDQFRNIYTTNYDNLLEIAQELSPISEKLRIITSETQLSDTSSNRAIIKLHGDITKSAEKEYEFDGDRNLKYIIAKEDYDTYLVKHQGFSYLMRLAMLQGRFCLVGFSGTDPNYMLWLQWMKDVMDKAIEKDSKGKKEKKVPEKRVYLISAFPYKPNDATELFYKNHHVGVIDLTNGDVQKEMIGHLKVSKKSVSTFTQDARELLQMFFRYLQEDSHKNARKSLVVKNGKVESYNELWASARKALLSNTDIKPLLEEIEKTCDSSVTPISVEWQNILVRSFVNESTFFDNEDYRRLFALAVRDLGSMPSYYREVLPTPDCMNGDAIWNQLKYREKILRGEAEAHSLTRQGTPLDKVMNYAFRLEFLQMYEALQSWNPKEDEQPQAWMLQSLFDGKDDERITEWDRYIANQKNEKKRINACSMRNMQARTFPPYYDLSQEIQNGAVTISQKIKEASKDICPVEKNTSAYGMISKSFSINQGNLSYERSTRLVNLLYDNAYTPNYYAYEIINSEDWYDIFTMLYEEYPYAAIYYSAYIRKGGLLKKMGQDIAYSRNLRPKQKEILIRILAALGESKIPKGMYQGLLSISSELYVSVAPIFWTELFLSNVLEPTLNQWNDSIRKTDDVVRNIANAIQYITDIKDVNSIFLKLLRHIDETPDVINMLCANYLQIKHLQADETRVKKKIEEIIEKGSLQTYGNIYYLLVYYKKLSESQVLSISNKLLNENLGFATQHPDKIVLLAQLAQSPEQRNRINELVFKENIWDGGVKGSTATIPSFIDLVAFPEDWGWSDKDLGEVISNMETNINAVMRLKGAPDEWFRNNYLQWIERMLFFVKQQGYWDTAKGAKVTKLLKALMNRYGVDDTIDILLLSNDFFTLHFGIQMLVGALETEPKGKEIQHYESEISVLLTRAMMLDGTQYQTIVDVLFYLVKKYSKQMIGRYSDKLEYILQKSLDLNYKELNINLAMTQNKLCHIARVMNENGDIEDIVQKWLTDEMLARFNGAQLIDLQE